LSFPPQLAFGTGGHPTTANCLRLLVDASRSLPEAQAPILHICIVGILVTACNHDYKPHVFVTPTDSKYLLGTGDALRVIVFEQPELTTNYTVDASGKISVPLAGLVKAKYKTTSQVEAAIESRLRTRKFVKDPKVSVEIVTYRPFYILGEVKSAGKYPYENNITVESAIAIAGGYTDRAEKQKVRLTRKNKNGKTVVKLVDTNYQLHPGDTIAVRERWF
ncbi:MAG: polysaccharide biosynthesis/export family protein, partial [Pseudomonadota bacterium]